MKFYIHTTGCKANQWDSYVISSKLEEKGLTPGSLSVANIVIINGCTLTEGAEKDLRRFINHARVMNKEAKIVLAGCHAQVYPGRAFGADLVLGQKEKFHADEFLMREGLFVEGDRLMPMEGLVVNGLPAGRTRVFLKIQDGCDQFCSYCVVPFARGKARSRSLEEILTAMRSFGEKGVKEIVLTGIEISAYKDPFTGAGLKGLLQIIEKEDTPQRIRISSIDPLYLDDEFIHVMASSAKIMKSLHIPLQSGSDEILRKMGRRYTAEYVGDLIHKLTRAIPEIGIGMDVMVGFPTENDSRFAETYHFLKNLDIYYLHVFPFSARQGTRAAAMTGGVENRVKKERVGLLRKLDSGKRRKFFQRFLGNTACIAAEGRIYRQTFIRGYSENYIPVCVPYEKGRENKVLNVRMQSVGDGFVIGEPIRG